MGDVACGQRIQQFQAWGHTWKYTISSSVILVLLGCRQELWVHYRVCVCWPAWSWHWHWPPNSKYTLSHYVESKEVTIWYFGVGVILSEIKQMERLLDMLEVSKRICCWKEIVRLFPEQCMPCWNDRKLLLSHQTYQPQRFADTSFGPIGQVYMYSFTLEHIHGHYKGYI